MTKNKMKLGWSEWCSLPELGLPAVKVKVDTGAKTSALHAFNMEPFKKGEKEYIRFDIHPIQRNKKITVSCEAELVDKRHVKSSSGKKEKRHVIHTPVKIGRKTWEIQITLTNRDSMGFRMLLGREAMNGRILINPSEAFLKKNITRNEAKRLYKKKKENKEKPA